MSTNDTVILLAIGKSVSRSFLSLGVTYRLQFEQQRIRYCVVGFCRMSTGDTINWPWRMSLSLTMISYTGRCNTSR